MVARDAHSLARALHDGISQDLVALSYRIELLADAPDLSPAHARELRAASMEISSLIRTVRDQIYLLRNSAGVNIEEVLHSLQQSSSVPLHLTLLHDMASFPSHLVNPISEIATELVRNSQKHAGASRIELILTIDEDSLTLKVCDDGRGGVRDREGHFGLQGVREIAQSYGGILLTTEVDGTHQCLTFPLFASS